jgi:hypothetical protein
MGVGKGNLMPDSAGFIPPDFLVAPSWEPKEEPKFQEVSLRFKIPASVVVTPELLEGLQEELLYVAGFGMDYAYTGPNQGQEISELLFP